MSQVRSSKVGREKLFHFSARWHFAFHFSQLGSPAAHYVEWSRGIWRWKAYSSSRQVCCVLQTRLKHYRKSSFHFLTFAFSLWQQAHFVAQLWQSRNMSAALRIIFIFVPVDALWWTLWWNRNEFANLLNNSTDDRCLNFNENVIMRRNKRKYSTFPVDSS